MKNSMSTIEVQREDRSWSDYLRSFNIVIDGKVVGGLYAGGSSAFEVPPGSHEVFLKIDWCRSEKLNIGLAPGEVVRFLCGSRANPLTIFYWITFGSSRYLALARIPEYGRGSETTEDEYC
jgi:hypothetical protein